LSILGFKERAVSLVADGKGGLDHRPLDVTVVTSFWSPWNFAAWRRSIIPSAIAHGIIDIAGGFAR
jgi:hypothetical protein